MKEEITLRLFEDPAVPTCCHEGRYHPDDMKGWNVERGDMVALAETDGGRLFGIVDRVEDEIHEQDGRRYKLAVLWTQD